MPEIPVWAKRAAFRTMEAVAARTASIRLRSAERPDGFLEDGTGLIIDRDDVAILILAAHDAAEAGQ